MYIIFFIVIGFNSTAPKAIKCLCAIYYPIGNWANTIGKQR